MCNITSLPPRIYKRSEIRTVRMRNDRLFFQTFYRGKAGPNTGRGDRNLRIIKIILLPENFLQFDWLGAEVYKFTLNTYM